MNNLSPVIYEDGNQMRDFVFVEDVARANILVMENEQADYRVFNVGTGIGTRVREFAGLLRDAYRAEGESVMPGEFRPMDVRHLMADSSRLRALGWEPRVPVREGVMRYAEWLLSQPTPKEYFSRAEELLRRLRVVRKVAERE